MKSVASGLGQYEEPQKDPPQKVEFDGAATVVDILKRVPAKSVCRIRCVSKMLSIVDSPSFVKLHSTLVFDPDSRVTPAPPQFILHYGLSRFYPPFIHFITTFPKLLDQSSSRRSSKAPIQSQDCSTNLWFIFPLKGNRELLCIPSACTRQKRMATGNLSSTSEYISFRYSENVCAHGDMHWLLNYYIREGIQELVHILSFDFKKEEFFWIPNPYQLHLINFRGSMAIVDTTSGTNIEIWVMKDYNKKQWMWDYSISIQVLELDPQFNFSEAVCCEWEHGILFLLDDDESTTLTSFLDLRGPVVTKNLVKCPIEGKLS
ncbi:hypothetical protein ACLB2K_002566 [Fragaria x ananassa]